jgi:hypothetical protein
MLSEAVKRPKTVINTPNIENIRPIGILISTISLSSYQNIILKTTHITPTIIARPAGLLCHGKSLSTSWGVRE